MRYTSDLTEAQYQLLEPLLPKVKQTRPRKWSYHQLLNGMLYALVSGCQWRNLPRNLPPWSLVYTYFRNWKMDGTFDKMLTVLHEKARKKIGKNSQPSLVIIDSQAVKNTDCASEIGWCHYKCTNGIKRHLLVDVL